MMKILILIMAAVSILFVGMSIAIIAKAIDVTRKWGNIFSDNGRDGF